MLCDYELVTPPPKSGDCYALKSVVYAALEKTGIPTEPRRFLYGIDPVTSTILVRSDDARVKAASRAVHPVPIPKPQKLYDYCLSASPMVAGGPVRWRCENPGQWLTERAAAAGIELVECFTRSGETWCGRGSGFTVPTTVWVGQLRVKDAGRLSAVLVRGLGRHKAFGFGLLQLYT